MRAQLGVSLGQCSWAGEKSENQDFCDARVPEGSALALKGVALALADGISTSALGREAAEVAVASFLTDYFATCEAWSVRTSAQRVIAAINSWMHARNRQRQGPGLPEDAREKGLVCTLSALVLKGRSAYVFHVGDARIAHFSEDGFTVLTEAHRLELGGGESLLARAVGIDHRLAIDHAQVSVRAGDVFILTSDGVHDHVPGSAFLAAARSADLDRAARELCAAAIAAGSADNVTVQIVRIESLPDSDLDDVIGEERALPPAPALMAGQDFEGFSILRTLHAGHRSHVYLARDRASGGRVVLKAPAREWAGDPHERQRLMLEEWVARRVRSGHVLAAPQSGGERRHAYAVFDYLPGQTLEEWAYARREPDLVAVRALIKQIASGLLALHRREILHGDLRPANVIVDGEEIARIIDFGSAVVAGIEEIAPRAQDAAYAGTMQFTAPEIWLGALPTRASDLWSLGAIAYFLLTRSLPYGPRLCGARTRAAQRALRYIPASEINPEVPAWMDAALARALALDPGARYAELSEFTYDLTRPNPSLPAAAARPLHVRKPERVWQAASAVLAIALAVSLLFPRAAMPERPQGSATGRAPQAVYAGEAIGRTE
ncbi:bifunctional serine/threonine-protein phosphatase/kinase [Novosphingobium sp. 1949]|uniref:Bifunctional serine/threonine-protein phosphatase/kinase n=1 Tax=Novosphingobium organovorum TaxID=2930092 RepID=A0ABT0BBN9_9SPHN|nr:bifunctional protein-serine/threonine kinase/phosphatase [Novosphingobium organovorum]MCJ2182364.1 bifunctional serine/threonine-protein phosphatase/kinase [Novosphingobium organovorum]